MLVEEAKNKICPTGDVRNNLLDEGCAPFCLADRCMAWRWHEGHEAPHEERVVWYGDNLYPLPGIPEDRPDFDEQDRTLIQMLRDCHADIRANIVRDWNPPAPAGGGWTLIEKRWNAGDMKPSARFARRRANREGYCGFVGMMRAWSADER